MEYQGINATRIMVERARIAAYLTAELASKTTDDENTPQTAQHPYTRKFAMDQARAARAHAKAAQAHLFALVLGEATGDLPSAFDEEDRINDMLGEIEVLVVGDTSDVALKATEAAGSLLALPYAKAAEHAEEHWLAIDNHMLAARAHLTTIS